MNDASMNTDTPVVSARAKRDMTHNSIRQTTRMLLNRSNVTVAKTITGKATAGPVVTFQVAGEGVKAPFNRYYLGKKLDRKLDGSGYHAELRRKDRGEDSILIDVFVGARDADSAE